MKNRVLLAAAALSIVSTAALAQSAKFAAVYSEDPMMTGGGWASVSTCTAVLDPANPDVVAECIDDSGSVATGASMASIRVPNRKELLVGLSAQVGLYTETVVRGKKGSTSYAMAFAEGSVGLRACNADDVCYESVPRDIVLSNRKQELEATLAGIIEECSVEIDVTEDAGGLITDISGAFDLNDCTVSPEEIGLALETLAAHHYNFIFPRVITM
jgi:hypothetical protein